jgi:NAD dependent epimerase/dehydratase family enzyme
MRVLVTGAGGELGQTLVARLVGDGHSVCVLTRSPFRAADRFGDSVDICEWHPQCEEVPTAAVAGISAVAHLLGGPVWGRPTPERLEHIRASRVVASEKLMSALEGRHVRLVAASLPCLNASLRPTDIEENAPRQQSRASFESTVLAHERAIVRAQAVGNSVVVVRLGLILGSADGLSVLTRLGRRYLGCKLDDTLVPAIDIEDAAALFAGLLERPDIEGFVNGVAPTALAGEDVTRGVAEACGRQPYFKLPERLLSRYAGELAPFLLNRRRIAPTRLQQAGAAFAHPELGPSLRRTLMRPRSSPGRKRRSWRAAQSATPADPAVPAA